MGILLEQMLKSTRAKLRRKASLAPEGQPKAVCAADAMRSKAQPMPAKQASPQGARRALAAG